MPRSRRSKAATAIGPDTVLRCVESYTAGPGRFYAEGTRLRRESIAAFSEPYWIADASPDEDVYKARDALRGGGWREPQDSEAPKPVAMVRATKAFTHVEQSMHAANIQADPRPRSATFVISVGDTLPKHHALVEKYPANFEPVKDDD